MADDSIALEALIERLRRGDAAARRELLERACERLRRLAARILNESFPALALRHEVDSVVHETWLRLFQALETVEPPSVADFFRLAAHKVRQVLLDMAQKQRLLAQREADGTLAEIEQRDGNPQTYDPARLALWTEFHERVARLEEEERTVFEMHYYLGLPQIDVARILELHPRKVSYLWIAATEKLAEGLKDSLHPGV